MLLSVGGWKVDNVRGGLVVVWLNRRLRCAGRAWDVDCGADRRAD